MLLALITVMCLSFGGLLIWCIAMMTPGGIQRSVKEQESACNALVNKLETALGSVDFKDQATRVIFESTGYDRLGLDNFLTQVAADQKTHASGATDTISIMKAKQVQSGDMPKSALAENTLLRNAPDEKRTSSELDKAADKPAVGPIVSA